MESNRFYKNNKSDKIWWVDTDKEGFWLFSFDKKTIFNMYQDYPYKLTAEQKEIFDKENPHWAKYFEERNKHPEEVEKQ